MNQHIKQEHNSGLSGRPSGLVNSEPGSSSTADTGMTGPEFSRYRVPGAYEDSDSEDEGFQSSSFVRYLGGPSRSAWPSQHSALSLRSYPEQPPLLSQNPAVPHTGFGSSSPLQYAPNVPAIELARQNSMARQEAASRSVSSGWLPVGPAGQRLQTPSPFGAYPPVLGQVPPSFPSFGTDRPGFVTNGSYYPHPGYPVPVPSLAATINRVNSYDFNAMRDENGDPFNSRLVDFLDDYVNDPRKTEEDIQQLLSNIRPDMEIPEEERGETPEAIRYPLYAHQQLALKWMTDMEEGTNKGGILADDMGLGKTISTLALMVSRQSSDNIKVCTYLLPDKCE